MHIIQQWINQKLLEWGIVSHTSNEIDNIIMLGIIFLIALAIDYTCRYFFLNMFKRLAQKTRNQWDDLIVEQKIINKLMHIIPAILVYIELA